MLSIIIPAYNEEDGIASIVERVLSIGPALRATKTDLELIVVDDGSRDRTAEIAGQYPDVRPDPASDQSWVRRRPEDRIRPCKGRLAWIS